MTQENVTETAISVRNLYKIFGRRLRRSLELVGEGASKEEVQEATGDTVGVNNVSFDIYPEETFIVMGLSGSGKSTLVRCVIRLIEPTRGTVEIKGEDITRMDESALRSIRRRELGMVFQQFALFPHRTVRDNVAYGLEVQGISRKERHERAEEVLEMVGLAAWEDYRPTALSGGMQQRVGLARALAHDPNILLMDEPFSALDPLIRRDMQAELVDMQRKLNKSIMFITHDLDEALKLGDRIAIMNQGEVVQVGTPKEIVTEPADDYVADFVRDVDRFKILSARDAIGSNIPVLPSDTTVKQAWKSLSDSEIPYCVMVNGNRGLVGTVYAHDVRNAVDNGKVRLSEMPVHEAATASPKSSIERLLPKMSANYHPVVLLDERDRVEGVVDASSLVASLVRETESGSE